MLARDLRQPVAPRPGERPGIQVHAPRVALAPAASAVTSDVTPSMRLDGTAVSATQRGHGSAASGGATTASSSTPAAGGSLASTDLDARFASVAQARVRSP